MLLTDDQIDKALEEYLKKYPELKAIPTWLDPNFGVFFMEKDKHIEEFTERNPALGNILSTYLDFANRKYQD